METVKRAIDGFNRGDLDAAAREFHPDAEVDWSRSKGVEAGIYRGRERTQRFWATFLEMFESVVAEPEEFIDDGDCVIVLDQTRMRGRDGIEVQARNVTVVTLRPLKCHRASRSAWRFEGLGSWRRVGHLRDTGRTMPQESKSPDLVELTHRIFDAASRRDWDAVMDFHTPASVWDASRFEVGAFEGPTAIRGFFEDWIAAYEDFAIELEEVADLGNGVAFVVYRQKGRLVGSSSSLRGREGLVYKWVDEMIVSVTAYPDIDEARAAAERLAEERG